MKGLPVMVLALELLATAGCAQQRPQLRQRQVTATAPADQRVAEVKWFRDFLGRHQARLAPLVKANNLAYWIAAVTGNQDAYTMNSELEVAIRRMHADPASYRRLQRLLDSGKVKDALLARQLRILHDNFQENQTDAQLTRRIVALATEVQQVFNTYRGQVGGKRLDDGQIIDILKNSADTELRRQAWEAYKKRGALVRERVIELARLRNQVARGLGFANFYDMRLRLMEQDPAEIRRIFDELARATDQPFAGMMRELRQQLARRYGVSPADIRPWHFEDPFFQEAPAAGAVDLDGFFAKADQKRLVGDFYAGIGLDVSDVLAHSDLFAKPGKMPHAFCTDIDRAGDVRILANLSPCETQTSTLLHEAGHAVYSKYIDPSLPWLLREEAHPFTTEAVAMLFGRLTRNPGWLRKMLHLDPGRLQPLVEKIRRQQRLGMLIMARWTLVMVNFERGFYENPDQDLNKLWWDLKSRYQLLEPPPRLPGAADWASKIHIAAWPVYYHNYLLGEMMASQLHYYLARKVLKVPPRQMDYAGQKAIGEFLRTRIFAPGKSLRWDELLRRATGESLNPRYFVEQFVE